MASALENYVNNVRTLSASGSYRELADHLNETGAVELLSKNWSILDNVLETLDIQQHSLGVLYVLLAKLNTVLTSNYEPPQMVRLMKDFIHQCNGEQVRFATDAYYDLCHMFTNYIMDDPHCILCIKIIADAIEKIRLFESQLTPVHSDLCCLSLKARSFKIALQFLDIDITAISTGSEHRNHNTSYSSFAVQDANNDAKYFLQYYYYGGMIYTAYKNFDRALYFYEVCISTPAMTLSHIMLEAYKKFILVSLILRGKISPIPKYSSQIISRFMKPLAQVYHDLASAYYTSSSEEVRIIVNKHADTYARDLNMGLVKQVAASLYKKNIQRLTRTFLTLSLSDVANRVQLPSAAEAEKLIFKMIASCEIYASINQKDGMVVFKDRPENYDSPEMFLAIEKNMTGVMDLMKEINKMDEEIMLNPLYVKKSSANLEDEVAHHSKAFSSCEPID